ncbi:hypothetical protein VIGAN_08167100 [Vigna angularis var. angularis]|uniref:Uncharacterized protein n=1 Tax=Vigna angularis var. angularis TaxID=157739 RepID=A0A0S3SQ91_PHAAN|nr:hypothetical protein VIGAN_08167100 [Vigna angularis var. angularis]
MFIWIRTPVDIPISENCPCFSFTGIYHIRTSASFFYTPHLMREHSTICSFLRTTKSELTAGNRQICILPIKLFVVIWISLQPSNLQHERGKHFLDYSIKPWHRITAIIRCPYLINTKAIRLLVHFEIIEFCVKTRKDVWTRRNI